MFENLFKKNNYKKIEILVDGMHCTSCATNIDLTLEELPGVKKADTNYARSKTILEIEEKDFDKKKAFEAIEELGYKVKTV